MKKSSVEAFNSDVINNSGYLYTTNEKLSSKIANSRLTDVVLENVNLKDRRVLDLGCGDGTYTFELFDRARPKHMTGVDAAQEAIALALKKKGARDIDFITCSADKLPFAPHSYDIVHLRGLLHHLPNPVAVIEEALRVAPELILIEPNGYNPVLKLIEKFSRYHIEHQEKSYTPATLCSWLEGLGAKISFRCYAGLVPFFCSDEAVKVLKSAEPFVERIPLVRALSCAVHVVVARKD